MAYGGRRRVPERLRLVVLYASLIGVALAMLFPLYWMLVTALTPSGKEFAYPPRVFPSLAAWSSFPAALTAKPFHLYFRNSLIIAVASTLGALLTESMAGHAFARLRFPGRDLFFSLCLALMMLPYVVTLIPRFVIFRHLGMVDTLWPLIIPFWFGGTPFGVFLFRQYCRTLPMELDEAAKIDGAGYARIFWSIIMPQCAPILVTLGVLHFVFSWNDFIRPLVYLHSDNVKTVMLGISGFRGLTTDYWNLMMAAAITAVLPIILVVLAAQKFLVRGVSLTGMGGR